MHVLAERQSSNPGITDAQQLGLLVSAVSALVVEMRNESEARKLVALWHTAVGVVVGVTCFTGLWLLLPAGMVVIK